MLTRYLNIISQVQQRCDILHLSLALSLSLVFSHSLYSSVSLSSALFSTYSHTLLLTNTQTLIQSLAQSHKHKGRPKEKVEIGCFEITHLSLVKIIIFLRNRHFHQQIFVSTLMHREMTNSASVNNPYSVLSRYIWIKYYNVWESTYSAHRAVSDRWKIKLNLKP